MLHTQNSDELPGVVDRIYDTKITDADSIITLSLEFLTPMRAWVIGQGVNDITDVGQRSNWQPI
jgi:hypothetical protein